MSVPQSIELSKIIQSLRHLRANTTIPLDFASQMTLVNKLLRNDTTGIVNSVLDFQLNSATVPLKIETKNDALDNALNIWQYSLLNKNLSIDAPRGLRDLSAEYYKERWKSSFVALMYRWEDVTINKKVYSLPLKMWFLDGASLKVKSASGKLNSREYFIQSIKDENRIPDNKTSAIIRKPYASWYEDYPVPYLVRKGTLFNALLKEAVVTKQADVIESMIPYLLLLKSGTDKLAELDLLADGEELKKLKESLVKAQNEHDITGSLGKLVTSLSYDVNMEHFMPDLLKVMHSDITKATDKNILASLGMIEVQGFSSDRQETILNPKILVEEIKDSVLDWSLIIEEVVHQIIERNRNVGIDKLSSEVRVVPGSVKTFVTEGLKNLYNTLYSRGLISKQSVVENVGDFDYEVERERRKKETAQGDDDSMKAPIVQRQEQQGNTTPVAPVKNDTAPDEQNQNKPGDNTKVEKAELKTIDDLPEEAKHLPVNGQIMFLKAYNSSLEQDQTEEESNQIAWNACKTIFKLNKSDKWVKKTKKEFEASLEKCELDELLKLKKIDILSKQENLLNKLLKEKDNENL